MSKIYWIALLILLIPLAVSHNDRVGITLLFSSIEISKPAQWPLADIKEKSTNDSLFPGAKKTIFIRGAKGVPLSKLIDQSIFGGFHPGLTIEEAAVRFGKPFRVQSDRHKTLAIYILPSSRIEVEDQPYGSGCSSFHRRTVYAYPKRLANGCNAPASELLHSSINAQIQKDIPVEVSILDAGDSERVWVFVQDGCVQAINWWKVPSEN